MPFFTAPGQSQYRAHRGGSAYDEDSERLPDGMVRCGYDADTQRYSFRDTATGATWEGSAGTYYGHMTRVSGGGSSGRRQSLGRNSGEERDTEDGSEDWEEEERDWEKEVGGDGLKLIVGAVMSKVWKKVDLLRHDDTTRAEPRGHDFVRRLTTTRRPRKSDDRKQSTDKLDTSRRAVKASSVDFVGGKEIRLTLIAAGVKRTIFDVV